MQNLGLTICNHNYKFIYIVCMREEYAKNQGVYYLDREADQWLAGNMRKVYISYMYIIAYHNETHYFVC